MMKVFSGVQSDILKANKKNQLVSAGAGSGKTTVMIEKISNLLINDEVDIDNLLVVTFTVLAATEMKDRLINNLKARMIDAGDEQKQRLLSIIEKIDTANIDTIDGFSSKTIKKYFYDLQISPNVEIISDTTKDYYLTKAMKKTFDANTVTSDDVGIMLDLFGGNRRNLEGLQDLILSGYYNVINIENSDQFLLDCLNEYQDSIKSEKVLNDYICSVANKIIAQIIEEYGCFTNQVKDKLNNVVEKLKHFNNNLSFKSNLQTLIAFECEKFSTKDYKENEGLKILNSKIEEIVEIKNNFKNNEINENYNEKNEKIINYLLIFINFLKKFIKNYNNIKEKYNLIDFNDLNRVMLKFLKNENIKR